MGTLSIPITVVLIAVFAATLTDLRAFRISNLLTLPLVVTGLMYHGYMSGMEGLTVSMGGIIFGFLSLFAFFLLGGMGGGDVKLMAGIGAWLGWPLTFLVFIAAALAAGLYALFLILANGQLRETWVRLQLIWYKISAIGRHIGAEDKIEAEVRRDDRRQRLIPFAAMTMVGLLAITAIYRFRMADTLTEALFSQR